MQLSDKRPFCHQRSAFIRALKNNNKNAAKCMIENLVRLGKVRRTAQKGVLEKVEKSTE